MPTRPDDGGGQADNRLTPASAHRAH